MARSRTYLANGMKLAVTVALVICLTFPTSQSAQVLVSSSNSESLQRRKMVLGSKPPGCVNKCFSCRPCMATLVIPPHQKKKLTAFKAAELVHNKDDEGSYYLLLWKCRCGDKLFQP